MTFSPAPLTALGRYWVSKGGVNLGVVGDTGHVAKGTSYHLGKSQLTATAYSARTARDKAGLTEAASAIDLGKLGRLGYPGLRRFSEWFARRCMARHPAYRDVREVIFTIDGSTVLGWSDLSPAKLIPGYGDTTHLYHTHISFYRDSEKRDKVAMFAPYFEDTPPQEVDMPVVYATPGRNRVQVKAGTPYFSSPGDVNAQGTINATTAWFDEIVYAAKPDGSVDTSWVGLDGLSPSTGTTPLRLGWIRSINVAKREAIPTGEPLPPTILVGAVTYRR